MNKLALRLSFFTFSLVPVLGFGQYFSGGRSSAIQANGPSQNGTFGSTPTLPSITGDTSTHIITTAVPFLLISPDSRGAALGDAGVASSPDVNSAYWNAGKLAFIDKSYGGSASYTPWLGKIVNDMWLFQLAGFYKLNHRQAIASSMRYFNYGPVIFKDAANQDLGTFYPRDFSFDVTYSQLLTEHFSIGGSLRYIYSNLTGNSTAGTDAHSGKSIAADIGIFYSKPLVSRNATLSWGVSITNIGNKITYGSASQAVFIPTNLKVGGAYKTEVDARNSFTFLLDFNKLMVPSPNYAKTQNQKPLLSGILGSFNDAEGGYKEELREITTSAGIEYWYDKVFAGRLGYFYEAKDKGNRKYLTAGIGMRYQKFGLDVAYLVPTNQRENALAETIRFTIIMHVDAKVKEQEALTD
jgi:hypothetical protein